MATEVIVKKGNSKLGKGIGKVSLPPVVTCPGRGECEKVCYAVKLERIYKNYKAMNGRHLDLLENDTPAYIEAVIRDIKKAGFNVVRVHESGDFYSDRQIKAWHFIALALPDVHFYAYTRTWTVPSLVPALETLKALPNFTVRASLEEGETPPKGWAWNSIVPKDTTERPEGGIICHEQTGKKASCADCGVCWLAKTPVFFKQH